MNNCCGTCAYHASPRKTGLSEWTCNNQESEYYGLVTEYGDLCEEHEER